MDGFLEMFSYSFIWRAIFVGVLISACAALLGVNLVLRRYSMIGDGLSHVAFGAAAVAMALGAAPLGVSIPVVLAAAFLMLRLGRNIRGLQGDAAIALVSVSAVAVGVMFLSMSSGMNTDVYSYLFGSVLMLDNHDVLLCIVMSAVILICYLLLWNRMFAVTFDETFTKASGLNVDLYQMVLAAMTAIVVVLGMRMMGALLISGLLLIPVLSAMRLCRNFRAVTFAAVCFSVLGYVLGFLLACAFALPVGAAVAGVQVCVFLLLSLDSKGEIGYTAFIK